MCEREREEERRVPYPPPPHTHPNQQQKQIISVNPSETPGDNTTRTEITTSEHLQVVVWDHFARRKA